MKFAAETTWHDLPSSAAALEDLDAAYKYAARNAASTAARWLARFYDALNTLDQNPERCPLALEDDISERTLRQYLVGKRPNVFRVIYTVDGQTVWILRIRRAQRRPLTQPELGELNQ